MWLWSAGRGVLARRHAGGYAWPVHAAFRPIARLIATILLLQVVLAPAHCLAMAATPAGLETVLCSPAGVERTILIGPDGHEVPPQDAAMGVCVVCAGLPQAVLPEPPAVPGRAWAASKVTWHAAGAPSLPPGARGPPYSPTGPPTLS